MKNSIMPWEYKGMDEGDWVEVILTEFDSSSDGKMKEEKYDRNSQSDYDNVSDPRIRSNFIVKVIKKNWTHTMTGCG